MNNSRVECVYCQADGLLVHVKCTECLNIALCVQCFAKGVEFRNHFKTHPYRLIDNGAFSVTDKSWTANEEQLLLDGIEQFGIGNWEDVAQNIEGKTSKEIEEHYYNTYIESADLGHITVPRDIPNRMTDHTPPLHESILSIQLTPISVEKEQELELAYMQLRDDFEMEHDNDAEVLVSGLTVNSEEEVIDLDLKVAQVNMYLAKLRERHRRKSVAREYHIVEQFFGKQLTRPRQERDCLKKFRFCLQYMREEQAFNFARDIRREQNLRARIKQLKTYRKNGIKKLEDGIVFDVKQRRRLRNKLNIENQGAVEVHLGEKSADRLHSEYGTYLLNSAEKQLCKNLRMIPSRYLTTKLLIIKDFIQKQNGVGIKIRFPSYLEKYQRKKIQTFLMSSGWLPQSTS